MLIRHASTSLNWTGTIKERLSRATSSMKGRSVCLNLSYFEETELQTAKW